MTAQLRPASLAAGASLAAMAVLAPLGVMVALPAGETAAAGLVVLGVAVLDVVVAVGLYPLLRTGGVILAQVAVATRLVYAAVFATAAGELLAADAMRFQAIWDGALLVFGIHLVLVAAGLMRSTKAPSWLGALVALAGLGYLADTLLLGLGVMTTFSLAEIAFVGEVGLLIWLIGWAGRATRRERGEGRDTPRTATAPGAP